MQEIRVDQRHSLGIGIPYCGFAPFFLAKDSLERTAIKRTLKIKEMRPKISSHLSIHDASVTDEETQRFLNHKMAKS